MSMVEKVYNWYVGEHPVLPPTAIKLDKALIDMWKQRTLYTPDANLLGQYASHFLFVYDRLMEGRDDFNILGDFTDPIATGFTEKLFCTWKKNIGVLSFPIALETDKKADIPSWADVEVNRGWFKNAPPAIVKGQVFNLPTERIYELDKHYRNVQQYIRKRVLIQIPFRYEPNASNDYICRLHAWMYVGNSDHWEDLLDAGMFFSPVRVFTPNNQLITPYSFFEPPTGEVPKEDTPFVPKKPIFKQESPGGWVETIWVPAPLEENPYKSQLDGASPVQRIISEGP